METLREPPDRFEHSLELLALGYRLVVMRPAAKIPAFKHWPNLLMTEEDCRRNFSGSENNVGIITGGDLVVLDVDSEQTRDVQWVIDNVGDTPMKARTPSGGMHFYFRTRKGVEYGSGVQLRGMPYDLRWEKHCVCCPWSVTPQGKYEWLGEILPACDLPFMKVSPLRERKPQRVSRPVEFTISDEVMCRRARAWLACVEGAVSGQGGHNATFRVACKLTHSPPGGFGLSFEQAWPIIKMWNETCEPPWSDPELEHKLLDAIEQRK